MSIANIARQMMRWSYDKEVGDLTVKASIGASGAVSASKGAGLSGIVKEAAAGQYSVTLITPFPYLHSINARVIHASASGVANVQVFEDPSALQADFKGDATFKLQCYDYAGAAVNPPSGSQLVVEIKVSATSSRVAAWDL